MERILAFIDGHECIDSTIPFSLAILIYMCVCGLQIFIHDMKHFVYASMSRINIINLTNRKHKSDYLSGITAEF